MRRSTAVFLFILPLIIFATNVIANDLRGLSPLEEQLHKRSFALAESTLILPQDAPANLRYATREMAQYIFEMTGKKPEISPDVEKISSPKIYIGVSNGILPPDLSQCDYDGYFFYTLPSGDLLISGRSATGTEFAIYGFLQDVCGIRFYLPGRDGTFIPRDPKFLLPYKNTLCNPFFKNRNFHDPSGFDRDWFRHNRLISRYPCGHALYAIINQSYAETHPEYFAYSKSLKKRLLPGVDGRKTFSQQPCMSNLEVIQIISDYVIQYFNDHPDKDCVSLGVNDSNIYCECPDCERINEGSGWNDIQQKSYGKLAIYFYNSIAEKVSKVHPQKYMGVMGYHATRSIPEGESFHPSIIFRVMELPVTYFDPSSVNYAELIKRKKSCPSLMVSGWRYGSGYIIPNFPIHLEEQFLDVCKELEIFGISQETYPFWVVNGIKDWLYAQKMWDPALRNHDLLEEFARNMFAAGAADVLQFYDLARRTWENQRVEFPNGAFLGGATGQLQLYNSKICNELLKHLENAQRVAGSEIQGKIYLDKQVKYYRWLQDLHLLFDYWKQPEPQKFPDLTDWCINFERMRRQVAANFQTLCEPRVSNHISNWFPPLNNSLLLLNRAYESNNMQEWERYMEKVGDSPELLWLNESKDEILGGENLLKNPQLIKTDTTYTKFFQSFGIPESWDYADWGGSKKVGGRKIEVENGIMVLEGIQGRKFYQPLPIAIQRVPLPPGSNYLFSLEAEAKDGELDNATIHLSGYHHPPHTNNFKYFHFLSQVPASAAQNYSFSMGINGYGKVSFRNPKIIVLSSLPKLEKERFCEKSPPFVLPEPEILAKFTGNSANYAYRYEGLYDLKVRIFAEGKGHIKVRTRESWKRQLPQETKEVANINLVPSQVCYEFVHSPDVNWSSVTNFRITKQQGVSIKQIEFIPIKHQ